MRTYKTYVNFVKDVTITLPTLPDKGMSKIKVMNDQNKSYRY